MLQLKVKDIDFARLSKILAKYEIKASISKDSVLLDGNISNELIEELCQDLQILNINNFEADAPKLEENPQIIFSTVRKGEVYLCDLGTPYGCEIGGCRPVIIVSHNRISTNPTCTIVTVIPCTTSVYAHPTQLNFEFSPETMDNYSKNWITHTRPTSALTNQMRSIEKARFIRYLGKMNNEFMAKLQKVMEYSLDLNLKE